MENKSTAIEIGQRCRKFRNALGISQQGLADKIGTTPQNISKYEKEGIYNIEVIQEISKALGHDLLTDEVEAEGTVGEIGREILTVLVDFKGYMHIETLLKGWYMFGLSEERIVKEVFKLEKIGLCVREQYVDYYGENKDDIFITAKGAIYLKHIEKSIELDKKLEEVCTYEITCEGYSSYQELIDSEPIQKMIRRLNVHNGFRANLIEYLYNCHSCDYLVFNVDELESPYGIDLIQGNGIYFDIIFSMVMGFTRKDADYFMECKMSDEDNEFEQACYLEDEIYNDNSFDKDFLGKFKQLVSIDDSDINQYFNETVNCNLNAVDLEEKQLRLNELEDKFLEQNDLSYRLDLNRRYQEACKDRESKNPLEWFTKEDIEKFIKENILPAATDEEKRLEEQLIEIMKADNEVVKDYFKFPTEWEKNGLADLILSLYKVPTAK
jgi:transcriptional regulator with XRE-family HTH domain